MTQKKIYKFLKEEGHYVEMFSSNIEGVMLSLVNKRQICMTDKKTFRDKCKVNFKKHFGCEAHQLTEKQLESLFPDEGVLKDTLPTIHLLLKYN